jgi:CHAT domain-containing protein/Tfp pilus assembly protein PilF
MRLHNRVLLWGAFFLLPFTTFGQTTPKLDQSSTAATPVAEESQKSAAEKLLFADTLDDAANTALQADDLAKAEKSYFQALEIQQKLAPGSLAVAKSLNGLGVVAWNRDNLANAEDYFRQALAIRERLVPASRDVAETLTYLGKVAADRGDLDTTEQYYHQALDIRKALDPDSLAVAASLHSLGVVAKTRGDLDKAEDYYQQALAIRAKRAPDGQGLADTLNNLGNVARDRGDLNKAEEYHRQALKIREKVAPGGRGVAASLHNLGNVALDRGDLTKAEEYFRRAADIEEKVAPDSLNLAVTLNNLGYVAQDRDDLNKAEEYFRRALAIREKLAPESSDAAESLNSLGDVFRERGDLIKAEEYHRQALALLEKLAPSSLETAAVLNSLGDLARKRGDLAKAQEYYRQVLGIREKLAPESKGYAETLAALAGIMVQQQQWDAAAPLLQKALNVLESQISHLGGGEAIRSGFRAQHAGYYQDYIALLMRQKQLELALQTLERSRAQTMLEMLTEGHVDIHRGVDAALIQREHSLQADINAKVERRIRLRGQQHTEEQAAAINKEIEGLLAQYNDVEGQIRASSPSYAALTQPRSLSAKDIQQQLLDSDTLLLEYSLGEERSYVFAVTPTSLTSYELPRRAEIEGMARQVYEQLTARNRTLKGETESQRKARLTKAEAEYSEAAAALSRMVLAPVATQLKGKRLLIVSDGALQYIPFAVLPEPEALNSGKASSSKVLPPLVVEHEIVTLPSASVLAVLRADRIGRKEAAKAVAVLADPVFAQDDVRVSSTQMNGHEDKDKTLGDMSASSTGRLTRSVADVGLSGDGIYLPRLRFTRREADSIMTITPPGEGMKALDFHASRATATSPELAQYRVVHFATHGLLDSEHPELSGLVLSMVDEKGKQQNGFLELEDIYNLNLPAELVVLSACETGLGKQIQGEGLVGLTRGFMYAGASRVMASLWKVDDVATAELMGRFYKAMEKEGMRPAAALRQAQTEMWKQKDWSSPYYWAAFQMQGEWK